MEAKLNKYLCFRFVNRRFLCSFFCLYTRYFVDIQKNITIWDSRGFFILNLSLDALSFSILLLTLFFGITQMENQTWSSVDIQTEQKKNLSKYWTPTTHMFTKKNSFERIEHINYELLLSIDLWFRYFHSEKSNWETIQRKKGENCSSINPEIGN